MFRWLGEPLAIDLANTIMVVGGGQTVDLLANEDDLARWLQGERDRLGDCAFALEHLAEVRALRDAVHGLFHAAASAKSPPLPALEVVNAASAAAPVAPQLAIENERVRSGELVAVGDPVAQLLARLARSAIAILTGVDEPPLRICNAPSCGMFFLGSRRWCCAACGNRARAARHYQRSKAAH